MIHRPHLLYSYRKYKLAEFYFLSALSACLILLGSCHEIKTNQSHRHVETASIEKGKALSEIYCQSCHLLPDPSQADAATWENGILPAMGPRLGIYAYGDKKYPSYKNDRNTPAGYYPAAPVINSLQWQNIIDYYTSLSPDTMPLQQRKYPVNAGLSLFSIVQPAAGQRIPAATFIAIDTVSASRQVVIADMLTEAIYRFDQNLHMKDSFLSKVAVVDIERHPGEMITCNIGLMNPNNGQYGSVRRLQTDKKGSLKADSSMQFSNLRRPVQVSTADFNRDGKLDYLVCEFGHLEGALSWMEAKENNVFERHVLRSLPGAIKAYIRDVNSDGLPDIWALFTQGEEGVFLFTNKGNGQFTEEEVLRFPAINGSSYFELADFNNDGRPDILYTCGDNADYSAILKPYHGVYIYMNDSTNHFKKTFFFAMHGCFKAMARDFDGDGDPDIASISFFADFAIHPEESFIYLENKGGLDFRPFSLPGTEAGRWLTMDAGDVDGDGRTDIVLGNFSVRPSDAKIHADWQKGPLFLLLKNKQP